MSESTVILAAVAVVLAINIALAGCGMFLFNTVGFGAVYGIAHVTFAQAFCTVAMLNFAGFMFSRRSSTD